METEGVVSPGQPERPYVALTMGDPAGIGPEIVLKAAAEPSVAAVCTPVVFGDAGVLHRVAAACRLAVPRCIPLEDWLENPHGPGAVVVDCAAIDAAKVEPGRISAACGRAAHTYIVTAIRAALDNRVAAVATAPIHKEAFHAAGVMYPGHTEIFAALTGSPKYCMMLACDEFCVGFVTTHVDLAHVPALLSIDRVADVIRLTAEAARRLRGRPPRICVCGLNPHAGEHGLFGDEEERIIGPAVAIARADGLDVDGPIPPDTAFLPSRLERTDAYVAMYHDQGHIPFKMLAFDRGVNITLGLPIVRTSADHGTAFDIAWKGWASPNSLIQAISYAVQLGKTHPAQ